MVLRVAAYPGTSSSPETAIDLSTDTEQGLIERARSVSNTAAFEVGEIAAAWCLRFARGRTDGDFAQLVGLARTTVTNRRLVHERFCQTFDTFNLSWSHYFVALNWDDAEHCLSWADENAATVAELKAWRRMQHGEDLTIDADSPTVPEPEFEREAVAPMSAALPASVAELETEAPERAREVVPFRDTALEPAAEVISEQTGAEQRRQLRRVLNVLTGAFLKTQNNLGERFEPVVLEHVDRLVDELKRGETMTKASGLDERTVEGMLRGDS